MQNHILPLLDIQEIRNPKPTTFLIADSSIIVRIIYISYPSKDKDMVADINLASKSVLIYDASDTRSIISSFIGYNCAIPHYRELQTTGCDLEIIHHCEEIVANNLNEAGEERKYLYNNMLQHIRSIQYNYVYYDAQHVSDVQIIVNKINQLYLMHFVDLTEKNRQKCYCGITNNLDRRMEEHRNRDFNIYGNEVHAIVCMNSNIAICAERLLSADYSTNKVSVIGRNDIDTSSAGNGAEQDTCIVYLLMPKSLIME